MREKPGLSALFAGRHQVQAWPIGRRVSCIKGEQNEELKIFLYCIKISTGRPMQQQDYAVLQGLKFVAT